MTAGSIRAKKGQYPGPISRDEFRRRYLERFVDPAFDTERDAIDSQPCHGSNIGQRGRVSRLAADVAHLHLGQIHGLG